MAGKLVIGLDFGTASVRAIVVDATNGRELGHGIRPFRMPFLFPRLADQPTFPRFSENR